LARNAFPHLDSRRQRVTIGIDCVAEQPSEWVSRFTGDTALLAAALAGLVDVPPALTSLRYAYFEFGRAMKALRAVDQARTEFATIEPHLEVIQKQLARLATRRELAGTALGRT
jgi:hypothetical protein